MNEAMILMIVLPEKERKKDEPTNRKVSLSLYLSLYNARTVAGEQCPARKLKRRLAL
jgi:hypothetical protein